MYKQHPGVCAKLYKWVHAARFFFLQYSERKKTSLFLQLATQFFVAILVKLGQVVPYNSTLNLGNYRKHRLSKQRPQHWFELILHCCLHFSRCSCSTVKLTTLPPTTKTRMDLRTKKMTSDRMCSCCRH